MVSLLIGPKGTGKTKRLIEEINDALARTDGNVVVVEKNKALSFNVNYRARLVTSDDYGIAGFDELYQRGALLHTSWSGKYYDCISQ